MVVMLFSAILICSFEIYRIGFWVCLPPTYLGLPLAYHGNFYLSVGGYSYPLSMKFLLSGQYGTGLTMSVRSLPDEGELD